MAAKRRQRIEPDQELVALGASNLGAAFTAVGILLASLFLTPALCSLPQATLAATIVVAVLSLVDLGIFRKTRAYAKPDFVAVLATLLVTLLQGVEVGLVVGVAGTCCMTSAAGYS